MENSPDPIDAIPKRVWAIIRPDTFEVIALKERHTAEQACGSTAVDLGWNCGSFFAGWLPGSRKAEEDGAAAELLAADVTGAFDPSTTLDAVNSAMSEEDGYDIERFVARIIE